MRLLLADDEKGFADALAAILEHNRYSVDVVYNGEDALAFALVGDYDAILLDIMMPGLDGLTVLQRLRRDHVAAPVLLLTAKSEVENRIKGLDLGADDYLAKPFVTGELLARVRALTRRKGEYTHVNLQFGNMVLNRLEYTISNRDKTARLSGREFQMLETLMVNPKQIISTEQFVARIWGYDTDVEINVVWVNLSNIRKKLSEIGANVEIKAIRGIGYILEEVS